MQNISLLGEGKLGSMKKFRKTSMLSDFIASAINISLISSSK